MNWLLKLHITNPPAHAIAILSLVCVAGLLLGSVRFRGIKLGTSGVLFAALLVGHFSKPVDRGTLEFVKEFGLILFVFCIGLQLGPSFFASLRQAGLRFNLLALGVVVIGALTAAVSGWLLGLDGAAVLGVFAGASTNTPSLGAAQQTLTSFEGVSADRAALPALAYAVSYPLGIVGIIGSLLFLKNLLKIDAAREMESYAAATSTNVKPLERRTLLVENQNLDGLAIGDVPGLTESKVVVSRVCRSGEEEAFTATRATVLQQGDRILVVGAADGLDRFRRIVGRAADDNPIVIGGALSPRQVLVTRQEVHGRSIAQLELDAQYGVNVTRVSRGGVEMAAVPSLRVNFGDVLQVVGPEQGVRQAQALLGNSVQALDETQFVPLFAGIALGIGLGTLPIAFPGFPQPLRLGLAGGPLIVALVVGRFGRLGRRVLYIPRGANLAFREFGISLFFASVGLMAGPTFFENAFSLTGLLWMVCGICTTLVPLLTIGIVGRKLLNMNYVDLSGLLAGSLTDPPALAFANGLCGSEAPTVAYATVYPLTMLLRIMAAQALTVVLCG